MAHGVDGDSCLVPLHRDLQVALGTGVKFVYGIWGMDGMAMDHRGVSDSCD